MVGEVIAVLLLLVAVVIGAVCDVTALFDDGDAVILLLSVGVIELGNEELRDKVVVGEAGEGEETEEDIGSVLLNGDEDTDGKLVGGEVGEDEEFENEINSVLLNNDEDVDCSSVDWVMVGEEAILVLVMISVILSEE